MNSLADKQLKHFIGRKKIQVDLDWSKLKLKTEVKEVVRCLCALWLIVGGVECLLGPVVCRFDLSLIQIDIIIMSSSNDKSESEMLKKVMGCL
jgi:hypothetical protein